jgi:IPT/TIG domain
VVRIRGRDLPADPYVRFGQVRATVLQSSPSAIVARTPPHLPGTVDVTVSGGGQSRVLPAAYTFTGSDDAPPAPAPEPAPPPPAREPEGPAPRTLRAPYDAASGLRLDRFAPGHPLLVLTRQQRDAATCTQPSCPALPL